MRTRIPYAGDPEPTYIQHIALSARKCGYTGEQEPLPLILVPGYDAGAGFYFKNLPEVVRAAPRRPRPARRADGRSPSLAASP